MSWTPSEGLKRADAVVREIEASQSAIFGTVGGFAPVFRYRVTQLIAQALDQALADGAEQDAIAAMVKGNGVGFHEGAAPGPGQPGQALGPDGWFDVPPTADPAGVDLPDFPAPAWNPAWNKQAEPAFPTEQQVADASRVITAAVAKDLGYDPTKDLGEQMEAEAAHVGKFAESQPKKRGRPKGSTNKAKKKAKAAKKAGASLTDIPNAEAEPPAGEAAS